ncbi:MAG: hypothetical protein DME34_04570 [Verrucomicrobia bacterium]|nr:MAG: hypothetical protein DME34_04570 [Verrucomicrobiota bacterium]
MGLGRVIKFSFPSRGATYDWTVNLLDQQKIRIGACAWSFDDWRGPFYPPDLPESRWLEFYARYFPAVEIDSTFYSAPAEGTILRWIEATPAAFRFACKLPREITHVCRLRDCTAELKSFMRAVEPLAPKLQVVLIQLPPSFTPKDGKPALRKFLVQLRVAQISCPIAEGLSLRHRVPASRVAPAADYRSAREMPHLLGLGGHHGVERTQSGAIRVSAAYH